MPNLGSGRAGRDARLALQRWRSHGSISLHADVAQLVEHFTRNEGVRGSSPRVGSLVFALGLAWSLGIGGIMARWASRHEGPRKAGRGHGFAVRVLWSTEPSRLSRTPCQSQPFGAMCALTANIRSGDNSEGFRALAVAVQRELPVRELRRYWQVSRAGEPEGPIGS